MEKAVPPNQPPNGTQLTADDLAAPRPSSPFELTMNQSLHLERLRRDVVKANPDDLREMVIELAFQLMIKSNVANALMCKTF